MKASGAGLAAAAGQVGRHRRAEGVKRAEVSMGFRKAGLLLLLILTAAAAAAPGEAKKERFNIDIYVGWGGCYRPMRWTPIDVTIVSGLKKHLGGTVELSLKQDELTRMRIVQEVVLAPNVALRIPLVAKAAFGASGCRLEIFDARGRLQVRREHAFGVGIGPGAAVRSVGEDDMLIGVAGPAAFGLMDLPGRSLCRSERGRGKVYVAHRPAQTLPWDWTGYDSLDLLVLYDLKWDQLRPGQAKAIVRWVNNGGTVLLVLGSRQMARKNPLASLLPFEPGPARQVRVVPWWRRAGQARARPAMAATVPCWGIPAKLPRGWRLFWSAGRAPTGLAGRSDGTGPLPNAPVYAHGPVGFGRVGVLALDPVRLGLRGPVQQVVFWASHMATLLRDRQIAYSATGPPDDGIPAFLYKPSLQSTAANAVLEHLYAIPELRPLSIWVVIGLLVALAAMLGPIDYLVLKRLGRLPLTWLTSATCVLLFTVGAYYGVQALRSGRVQVRAVSVVDAVGVRGPTWRTTYCGIFAPASADYRLTDSAGRPLAATRLGQWWSSVVPAGPRMYHGLAEQATRTFTCRQGTGGNLPSSVPINIWSMQCFIAEGPAEGFPFRARVAREGARRLWVTADVVNTSDRPVRRGRVRLAGGLEFTFGEVPARARRRFSGWARRAKVSGGPNLSLVGPWTGLDFPVEQAYLAWGTLRRTRGVEAYLRDGAAVVSCLYDDVPLGFDLKGRDVLPHHIQLARLVVYPREGRLP